MSTVPSPHSVVLENLVRVPEVSGQRHSPIRVVEQRHDATRIEESQHFRLMHERLTALQVFVAEERKGPQAPSGSTRSKGAERHRSPAQSIERLWQTVEEIGTRVSVRRRSKRIRSLQQQLRRSVDDDTWQIYLRIESEVNDRAALLLDALAEHVETR